MKEGCRRIVRSTLLDAKTLLHGKSPGAIPLPGAAPRPPRASTGWRPGRGAAWTDEPGSGEEGRRRLKPPDNEGSGGCPPGLTLPGVPGVPPGQHAVPGQGRGISERGDLVDDHPQPPGVGLGRRVGRPERRVELAGLGGERRG